MINSKWAQFNAEQENKIQTETRSQIVNTKKQEKPENLAKDIDPDKVTNLINTHFRSPNCF